MREHGPWKARRIWLDGFKVGILARLHETVDVAQRGSVRHGEYSPHLPHLVLK